MVGKLIGYGSLASSQHIERTTVKMYVLYEALVIAVITHGSEFRTWKQWWKENISDRNWLAEKNLRTFDNPKAVKRIHSKQDWSRRNNAFRNAKETTQSSITCKEWRNAATTQSAALLHPGQKRQRKTRKYVDGQHKRRLENNEFEHPNCHRLIRNNTIEDSCANPSSAYLMEGWEEST